MSEAFPAATGPPNLTIKVHPSMQLGPYRVSTLSTIPADPSAGNFDFLKVSDPFNGASDRPLPF